MLFNPTTATDNFKIASTFSQRKGKQGDTRNNRPLSGFSFYKVSAVNFSILKIAEKENEEGETASLQIQSRVNHVQESHVKSRIGKETRK